MPAQRGIVFPIVLIALLAACGGGGGGGVGAQLAGIPIAIPTPTASPQSSPSPKGSSTPIGSPTPSPTNSPSRNVASYDGCPVFTAGDWYNADVSTAPIDPNSESYIGAANQDAFFAVGVNYEKINNATSSTPLETVQQKVRYHQFPVPYPWQSNYYIEPASDAHAMVVQTQTCHLYESYSTSYSNGTLAAYSGANWDLTKPFSPLPPNTPSSMASGLSLFAGMVKWEDYESGAIRHALNFEAPQGTVAQGLFVRPASDTDGLGSTSNLLMDGAHLRLKSTFQLSCSSSCPQAQMVVAAMKTYGIYLADTGHGGNGIYFANAQDGSNPWNAQDLNALGEIYISDFDLLTLAPVQHI